MERIERFHVESTHGVRIAVRTYGDPSRPALVLNNGIGCTDIFWAQLIEALRERVYLVDWSMRAHYDSSEPEHPEAYRVQDHADDLEAVCAQLGIEQAVFAGFSLGVMVQLEHFRRYRGRHRALVFISGTPSNPFESLRGVPGASATVLSVLAFGHRMPALTQRVMRYGLKPTWAIPLGKLMGFIEPDCPRAACASYLERLARFAPRPYLSTMLAMAQYDGREGLPNVDVPALVIAGTHDNMAAMEVMRELHAKLPDAEWNLIAGASHTILLSHGKRIAEDIYTFMRRRGLLG